MTLDDVRRDMPQEIHYTTSREDERPVDVFEALEELGYRYMGASSCYSDVLYCWILPNPSTR